MMRLGFSPCPNDTFIFYAIANRKIDLKGLDFSLVVEDVETLNRLALDRALDVTKVSCHAFYYLQNDYRFLRSGAALGRGCGPLVVSKIPREMKELKGKKIAIPGTFTTAVLLFKLYFGLTMGYQFQDFVVMPFHKILESVRDGEVDAGLIIHEGRFTYPGYGLVQLMDLGEWWEAETGMPIPLGGIIAKKSIDPAVQVAIENLIQASVNYSLLNREEALPYIKSNAQELSEEVIMEHIGLYVNNYTLDICNDGRAALEELLKRVAYCGGI